VQGARTDAGIRSSFAHHTTKGIAARSASRSSRRIHQSWSASEEGNPAIQRPSTSAEKVTAG
jgi:hypothetical protein